jgi:asparagine synthase (glutamine-hydrolysing)
VCGIAAATGRGAEGDARVLLEGIRHRGPDDSGSLTLGPVALAMARLAILDPTPGASQPMSEGGVHLVYNGEAYNFPRLRRHLEQAGWRFATTGDTEVVLKAILHWGYSAGERLEGMFALIAYDERAGVLWAARDRFGIKPLYWCRRPSGGIALASEASPLAACYGLGPDPAGVAEVLGFGSPIGASAYQSVHEVEPGAVTVFGDRGPAEVRPFPALAGTGAPLAQVLPGAVERHLVSDRPVALFLSGGFDSAALAAQASSPSLTAITLAYSGNTEDVRRARGSAAAYDLEHRVVEVASGEASGRSGSFLAAMDQPTVDGFNTYLVAGVAAEAGFPVALSGLGADEILGGYGYSRRMRRLALAGRAWPLLPHPVRQVAAGHLAARYRRSPSQVGDMLAARSAPGRHRAWRSVFEPGEVLRLTGVRLGLGAPWEVDLAASPRAQLRQLDFQAYLRPVLLRDTDVFSMAHGVEVRVPFLDPGVVAAAARPASKAYLAREWGDPHLLDLARRPKLTFALPWERWLGPVLDGSRDLLAGPDPWRGLVDPALARPLAMSDSPGRSPLRRWALVMLARWLERGPAGRRLDACPVPTPSRVS